MSPTGELSVTIGVQIAKMRSDFPEFSYSRSKNIPTWRGLLQPLKGSKEYFVKVIYKYSGRRSNAPKAWVLNPKLQNNPTHRYSDGSLCLYYPPDRSWDPNYFISETIIPWTALWLAFYEVWLETGNWYGPEVKHHGPKVEPDFRASDESE